MAAYRQVYDSRHLKADCREPGSALEPSTLGNRVWAAFTFLFRIILMINVAVCVCLADVLKQYLRNLPEPLMTFDLCDDWLAVCQLYVSSSAICNCWWLS